MSGVRVRFAPSPTGSLHLGNARTALFNYLFARQKSGSFILRVEDTDVERSQAEYEAQQLADLKWLGLDWDEGPDKGGEFGPYRQSERLDKYRAYAQELIVAGRAYECFCPEAELERERKWALAHGKTPRYSGRCRGLTEEQRQEAQARGLKPALRFRVEPGRVQVNDLIHGQIDFRAEDIGDFVIVRHNGRPSYNFACVVDDHLMAISHVIRGEDHLANTPRQLLIYQLFGWPAPVFAHHALLLGDDRAKLSKRHGATRVEQFRAEGILAEALVNYLALIGGGLSGSEGEIHNLKEIIGQFRLDKCGKSGVIFDYKKLNWFTAHHFSTRPSHRLAQEMLAWVKESGTTRTISARPDELVQAVAVARQNSNNFSELRAWTEILLSDQEINLACLTAEGVAYLRQNKEEVSSLLQTTLELLGATEWLKKIAERTGLKGRRLYHPLRLALTGLEHGPQLNDILSVLTPDRIKPRLSAVLRLLTD